MMLPDGKQVQIRSWKAIWLNIAEWITDRHPVNGEIRFGNNPKYMAIRTENVGFWEGFGEQLSNGYWVIGGTLNTRNVRTCSRALLEHFGIDLDDLHVSGLTTLQLNCAVFLLIALRPPYRSLIAELPKQRIENPW